MLILKLVLSNPRLRQIYDARGDRGLADASALGPRLTTAEEIIKELEKLEGQRAKEAVNKLVAAKGQLVLGIDATRLLHPRLPPNYTYSTLLKRLPSLTPSLQHATVTHAFSAPLTDSLKLSFRGSATARNGLGGTTLATTLHAPLPYNTQSEWTVVVNPVGEHSVSLKTATRLEDVAIQAQLASQGFNFPSFSMTAARTLWAGLNGFASYAHPSFFSDSEDSSFTLGLASDNWESQLTASPADSRLESTYSFPLRVPFTTSRSIRILLSASYSLARGLSYNLGLTRPFGAAKLNVTFESSGAGVSMLFRWNWMGQRLAIPVMLAHGFEPETSFWGFASCVAVLWGLDEFYLIPKRKKARIEARKAAREAKAELLESKKKDAEQAQSLLRPLAERKADAEGRKGGLVVLSADYAGFDVTVPLQAAVEGGQLRLGAVSKVRSSFLLFSQSMVTNGFFFSRPRSPGFSTPRTENQPSTCGTGSITPSIPSRLPIPCHWCFLCGNIFFRTNMTMYMTQSRCLVRDPLVLRKGESQVPSGADSEP